MNTKKNEARAKRSQAIVKHCEALKLPKPVVIKEVLPPYPQTKNTPVLSFTLAPTQQASQQSVTPTGVLVFGSATRPGGGWRNGARAQEEDVSLCSTWGVQAENAPEGFYKQQKGFGAKSVLCAEGFWLTDQYGNDLPKPLPCSFISIACPNRKIPFVSQTLYPQLIDMLAPRIVAALNHWQEKKIPHVVLGAIGCGVFEWDPIYSALAFKKAIEHSKYQGEIVFAFTDENIKKVFEQQLSQQQTPKPFSP